MSIRMEVEVLKRAKAFLQQGWTQNVWARDAAGMPVSDSSEEATCWCSTGAIYRAQFELKANYNEMCTALRALNTSSPSGIGIVRFNDEQESVEPVLEIFDRAIAQLEQA